MADVTAPSSAMDVTAPSTAAPPKKKKKRKPPTIIPIHPIDTQAAEEAAAATREVEVLVGEVFHPSPLISIGPSGIVVRGDKRNERSVKMLGVEADRNAMGAGDDVEYIPGVAYGDVLQDEDSFVGEGGFGKVYRVTNRHTGECYALKNMGAYLGSAKEDVDARKSVARELRLLCYCDSPHFVALKGCYFQDLVISIALEMMDAGSLDKVQLRAGHLPEPALGKISIAVLSGLQYMYKELHAMHRDIKPHNVLMRSDGAVKICDFGISNFLEQSILKSGCRTPAYAAPERYRAQYTITADVWSWGVSVIEMALGKHPYAGASKVTTWGIFTKVVEKPSPALPRDQPDLFSDEFVEFVDQCMEKDGDVRPRPAPLLDGPFCTKWATTEFDMGAWIQTVLAMEKGSGEILPFDPFAYSKEGGGEEGSSSVVGGGMIDTNTAMMSGGMPATSTAMMAGGSGFLAPAPGGSANVTQMASDTPINAVDADDGTASGSGDATADGADSGTATADGGDTTPDAADGDVTPPPEDSATPNASDAFVTAGMSSSDAGGGGGFPA